MNEIKLIYGRKIKEMIEKRKIMPVINSSVFAKCLKESTEKSFAQIDKKFEKLKKKIVIVGNPKTGIDLFGGRANPFIGCDTALKGKDKTIITLLTPNNPTEDSWLDKLKSKDDVILFKVFFDDCESIEDTMNEFANAGIKGAEAGKRFKEAIFDIKAKEVSKEKKKPIKQPCNPASRKFNKEFWR